MSHFGVLVIGPEVEKQLAPYHEFECTGENDQYVQDVDITDTVKADIDEFGMERGLNYSYSLGESVVEDGAPLDLDGAHKYGYAVVRDGNLIKAVRRTNPNAQWDWWVTGGRWSGFLRLKEGATGELGRKGLMGSCAADGPGRADIALKRDVDFDGMRDDAGASAAERWDGVHRLAAGQTWLNWQQVREKHAGNIDAAREEYRTQPAVVAIRKEFYNPFMDLDEYLIPREQFIREARDRATVLYALVMDGKWYAQGEMGWWGMSSDAMSQDEWNKKVNDLLDGLPDDTLLTVVDCHI